jgi:hypothetical protein
MKKITLLSAGLLLCISSMQAQTSGTLSFGTNILNYGIPVPGGLMVRDYSLQARVSYFATNHISIGLCLETGLGGNKTVPYGLTLYSRWYTGNKAQQTIKCYMEAGAGIADAYQSGEMPAGYNRKWMRNTIAWSAGINIFPTSWLALELGPEYRHIAGTRPINRIGITAGLKIFLSGQSFQKTFPDKFRSMY